MRFRPANIASLALLAAGAGLPPAAAVARPQTAQPETAPADRKRDLAEEIAGLLGLSLPAPVGAVDADGVLRGLAALPGEPAAASRREAEALAELRRAEGQRGAERVRLLRIATRLDPLNAEAALALAEALRDAGGERSGRVEFVEAVGRARVLTTPSAGLLAAGGRAAAAEGSPTLAAALFSAAYLRDDGSLSDGDSRRLGGELAAALLGVGETAAALELVRRGRIDADALPAASARRLADLALASGEATLAAALAPSVDADRRIVAGVWTGDFAAAALALSERMQGRAPTAFEIEAARLIALDDEARAVLTRHAGDGSETSRVRRGLLLAAVTGVFTPADLAGAFEARPQEAAALVLRDRRASAEVLGSCVELAPASALETARAILASPRAERVLAQLPETGGPGLVLLRGALSLELGRPREAIGLVAPLLEPGVDPAAASAAALVQGLAGARAGDWAAFDAAVTALRAGETEGQGTADRLAFAAQILAEGQRPAPAIASARRVLGHDGAGAQALLTAADAALAVDDRDLARSLLNRAVRLDREDDRPMFALLTLNGVGGSEADGEADALRLRRVRQALRAAAPDGVGDRLAQAVGALERDEAAAAVRLAEGVAGLASGSALQAASDLLVLVATRDAGRASDASREASAALRRLSDARPYSAPLAGAAATAALAQGQGVIADVLLERRRRHLLHDSLGRLHERIVAAAYQQPERLAAMRSARLDHKTLPPLASIERAGDLPAGGVTAWLRASLPEALALTAEQQAALRGLCLSRLSEAGTGSALGQPLERDAAEDLALLVDFAAARGSLDPATRSEALALRAAARTRVAELDRAALVSIGADLSEASGGNADDEAARFLSAVRGLSDRGRFREAAGLAALGATDTEGRAREGVLGVWLSAVGASGNVAEVEFMLEIVEERGGLRSVVRALAIDEYDETDEDFLRSEIAYAASNVAAAAGRTDAARSLLELSLRLDDDHPWACNDLGYQIAEEGGDLARAERLVRAGLERRPGNANMLDSLGWVLYKAGRLADDERGEGAVSILERAAEGSGRDNPTILLHLGDALVRAGRLPEAAVVYEEVRTSAIDRLMREPARRRSTEARRLSDLIARVHRRTIALDNQLPVPVEPLGPGVPDPMR